MSSQKLTKDQQNTADQNLIDGLQKHEATLPSILIAGVPVPTTSIITTLQSRIAARTATVTTRAAWQADVQAESAVVTQSAPTVSRTKQALKVMFADQITTLADFGLKPPKPPTPLTTEEKAAAKAKAKATRAARGTKGSKQKAQIKGTVPAPAVAPSPDPVTAPLAAPAPAGQATPKS
ncbi:MAG TPA: hypothetical protein VGG39_02725 [Polyangiaceae bacterium]|jgi:hypothetical protein